MSKLAKTQTLPAVESMADLVHRDPARIYHHKRMDRVDSKAIAEAIVRKAESRGGLRDLWDNLEQLLKERPL
jgi:hypothetical protein